MGIGKKLADKISEKGMTKRQVAELAKVPPSTLYSIIKRNNTKVEIDAFLRICDVLECIPEEFASEIPTNILREEYSLSRNEKKLIRLFRNFNDAGKEKLLDNAEDMAQLEKYKS